MWHIRYLKEYDAVEFLSNHSIKRITHCADYEALCSIDERGHKSQLVHENSDWILPSGSPKSKLHERFRGSTIRARGHFSALIQQPKYLLQQNVTPSLNPNHGTRALQTVAPDSAVDKVRSSQ